MKATSDGTIVRTRRFTHGSADNLLQPQFPFVLYSPKSRGYQAPDRVTVFLYEQYSGVTSTPQSQNALTNDRYSLFFQFDTFDRTGGTVNFQLNNIEQGRNLRKRTDPFTVIDDTSDFRPGTIGADGTLTADAEWTIPNDGVVVPLRLGPEAYDSNSGYFELSRYAHDPDGDGNLNGSETIGIYRPQWLEYSCDQQ